MPGDAQGRDLRAHLLLMPRDGTREPTFCCRVLRAGLGESGGPLEVGVPGLRHPLGRVSFTRGCPFQEKAFQVLQQIAWEFVGSSSLGIS